LLYAFAMLLDNLSAGMLLHVGGIMCGVCSKCNWKFENPVDALSIFMRWKQVLGGACIQHFWLHCTWYHRS
jgi:hypothetical protein